MVRKTVEDSLKDIQKKSEKINAGKPTKFSTAIMEKILSRVQAGEELPKICKDPDMPLWSTVQTWFALREGYLYLYAQAREAAMYAKNPPKTKRFKYSAKLFDEICERIGTGETMAGICREPDMPPRSTFIYWVNKDETHKKAYQIAQESAADARMDMLRDLPQFIQDPTRLRVISDNLKWDMARANPKKYGDRLKIDEGKKKKQIVEIRDVTKATAPGDDKG